MPKWLRAKITFPATATKRGKRRATCWVLTLQNLFDIFNSLAALSSPGGVVNVKLKIGSSIRFPIKCEKKHAHIKDIWPIASQGSRRPTHQQRCSRPSLFWTRQAFSQVIACYSLTLHCVQVQVTNQLENFVFLIANVCTRRKTACEQGLRLHRSPSLVCRESW